jgi:Chalcone isomerase-like
MNASVTPLRNAIYSVALCAVLMPATCQLAFANSPQMPPAVSLGLGKAKALGQTRLVVYGFNIYDAKLWAGDEFSVTNYENEAFALELRYLRNFNGAMIAERSLKEMQRISSINDEKAKQWLEAMKKTFPNVKKGDQLIGIHQPDGTASFVLNGKNLGEVQDEEFSRLFFGIWLSPKTSQPKMRKELIGLSIGSSDGAKK